MRCAHFIIALLNFAFALLLIAPVDADIIIDGINDFDASDTYDTSQPGHLAHVAADANNLYIGRTGVDIATGGSNHWVVSYFGVSDSSTNEGITFNTQQPNLPFFATHALIWRADGGMTQLLNYSAGNWIDTGVVVNQMENNANAYWEAALDLDDIGSPTGSILFTSYFVFTGSGFEMSYAVAPADSIVNGSYDPNLTTFMTISPVPEPASLSIFTFPMICLLRHRNRKSNTNLQMSNSH